MGQYEASPGEGLLVTRILLYSPPYKKKSRLSYEKCPLVSGVSLLYHVPMKTLITLLLACCLGGAMAQSNLPVCQEEKSTWTNCYGTETYSNGNKYVGEFKDNKPNGQGTFILADGAIYVGEFKDGMPNGQGAIILDDGDKYVGKWMDGMRNGLGTHSNSDGHKYVGEFKYNGYYGQGTFTWTDGRTQVGECKHSKRNGQVFYTFSDGRKYVGGYENDRFSGQGIEFQANGKVLRSGIWLEGWLIESKLIDVAIFTRISNLSNVVSNLAQLSKTEKKAKQK
jgi:hypothetical protein